MNELEHVHHDVDVARSLYCSGRLELAAKILQPIADRPDHDRIPEVLQSELLQILGLALHDLGRPIEATDALERASLAAPVRDEARVALAACYAQLRRIDLARELYLQLALSRRLSSPLMLRIAAGLESIDASQMAVQVCEWTIEKEPEFAQAHYDLGFYLARVGRPLYLTEALTRKAIELDPHNPNFRVGLVTFLIQIGQEDEAREEFLAIQPSDLERVTCFRCLTRIAGLMRRSHRADLADSLETRARAAGVGSDGDDGCRFLDNSIDGA